MAHPRRVIRLGIGEPRGCAGILKELEKHTNSELSQAFYRNSWALGIGYSDTEPRTPREASFPATVCPQRWLTHARALADTSVTLRINELNTLD